jgi:hypothetical protein
MRRVLINAIWFLIGAGTAYVIQHVHSHRPLLSDEARAELLGHLDEASYVRLWLANDVSRTIKKGEAGFDDCISVVAESLNRGPIGKSFQASARGHLLAANQNGTVLLTVDLHNWNSTLAGLLFPCDSGQIEEVFAKAAAARDHRYPNGSRRAEGSYEAWKKHGRWIYFYDTGEKMSEGEYVHGLKNGPWLTWDRNRTPLCEQTFRDGELLEAKAARRID